jgi:hypothetical protein
MVPFASLVRVDGMPSVVEEGGQMRCTRELVVADVMIERKAVC